MIKPKVVSRVWCCAVLLFMVACGRSEPTAYRPPSPQAGPQGAALQAATPATVAQPAVAPTANLLCTDQLVFVEDLTIPDGSEVQTGARLDKRWKVRNGGSCNWDDRYRVKLVAGAAMGALPEQALFPARGGTELIVRMQFVAPTEAGPYRSAWQAFDPQGDPFGDPFYIDVTVTSR
jgi:hypothetical protein